MRNSELFLIRAFVTKYPNSVEADSISARYTPVFYWCLVLLVFSITINERPYFHRIKPLKIGTFLLKKLHAENCCQDSVRETRSLQKFCLNVRLATGGY